MESSSSNLLPQPIPGERLEDFRARIGEVFDDTLQLQLDVLGQNYGLSKVPRHAATLHDSTVLKGFSCWVGESNGEAPSE